MEKEKPKLTWIEIIILAVYGGVQGLFWMGCLVVVIHSTIVTKFEVWNESPEFSTIFLITFFIWTNQMMKQFK